MDEASRDAFGDALRQVVLDAGAPDANLVRSRITMHGKERTDGALRIRAVGRFALAFRVRGRRVVLRLRATDRWLCTPAT